MRKLRKTLAAIGLVGGLLLCVSGTLVTQAASGTAVETINLTGGALSISNVSPGSITQSLTGGATTAAGNFPAADFSDATGSGAGWHGSIGMAAPFNSAGHVLAADATQLEGASIIGGTVGTTSSQPTYAGVAGTVIPSDTTSIPILSAAVNTGMGTYTVTPSVLISFTSVTYSGSYTATVTYTIMTAP